MTTGQELIVKQHLIDPEICIRCDTCEKTCPINAISHNNDNYVVDIEKCNHCMDCIAPCPTGSIDNWHQLDRSCAYSLEDQFSWEELPPQWTEEQLNKVSATEERSEKVQPSIPVESPVHSSTPLPPWSAAHAYINLYGPKAKQPSVIATVAGNVRVTKLGREYDTHHIVLDFGEYPFPVLEGQSIGVIPSGTDDKGKAHHARQYSVSSPRNGERPGYNNLSLTVKRVLENHQGQAVKGIGSNYMCDLNVGDKVQVIGPFGTSFLMPNHPNSNIVMICTGTGSAPMRAMTEWRRRLHSSGKSNGGKLILFFGARSKEDLPYFGPLQNLPTDFIDINFAFSRITGQPKRYVQDVMRERSQDLAKLLSCRDTFIYVCGLKNMEQGVQLALNDIAIQAGISWKSLETEMIKEGRLHFETY
jgi:benzoyl-CoA 2,3-dioxygenase component A